MKIRLISGLKNLSGKRILVRVDFNVPIKNGVVIEKFKIEKSLPTIKYLARAGAKIILVSHLKRPVNFDKAYSLKPVAVALEKLLKKRISFFSDKKCDSTYWLKAGKILETIKPGGILFLENIRFFKGESENDSTLAKRLSSLADLFVLDGFAVAHRTAASVTGVADFLPAYAGLLLAAEIEGLSKILINPRKPLVVVLAGVKMETKIPVLKNLLKVADHILIGGGLFNTFLAATGKKIGQSRVDGNLFKESLPYYSNKKLIKPIDVIVGLSNGKQARSVKIDKNFAVRDDEGIFDIGPETIKLFSQYIKKAATLVWNGATGSFEQHPYEYGTYAVARMIAERSRGKAFGVSGGGETIQILRQLGVQDDVDLISTGGGAMLEFLSGKRLPGVEAVKQK